MRYNNENNLASKTFDLSSKTFDAPRMKYLNRGIHFAISQKCIPMKDVIVNIDY